MRSASGVDFALEVHPAGWRFSAGSTWVAGWLRAGEHDAVTDIRAWIDDRPHLGLFGLPRGNEAGDGFSFLLDPPHGAGRLRLEFRNLDGRWVDFFQAPISSDPASPPAKSPALADSLTTLIPAVLVRRRRNPEQPLTLLAREAVTARLAAPLNVDPGTPLVGALEEPGDFGRLDHRRLAVTGWIAHRDQEIRRLVARVDPLRESILSLAPARTDILAQFPEVPRERAFTFSGLVDFPSGLERPALLTIVATLADGERVLAFARRFRERTNPSDLACPEASPMDFARAGWALIRAGRQLGLSVPDMLGTMRQAWNDGARQRPSAAAAPSAKRPEKQPIRVVAVTHNLNFEGAPRLLFELASFFRRQGGFTLRVLSPVDGPLRMLYEREGIAVDIVRNDALLASVGKDTFAAEATRVASEARLADVDLVIANTLASFWAVHLAKAAEKPVVFYVHESATPERFFAETGTPSLAIAAGQALEIADRVVFTAEASRRTFAPFDRRGSFVVLPSWLDGDGIRHFMRQHERAALRAKHGFGPDEVVVLNLGTVCERKGQQVMVQAIEQLEPRLRADRPVVFALVGLRDDEFGRQMAESIRSAGLTSVRLIPETRENLDYHRLADVLVCTSFEESSPRVLLEAALFGTPIVTTDVDGIPEILSGHEAHLVPAGDPYLLAAAIRSTIDELQAGDRRRANRAATRVSRRYDQSRSLPEHLSLARAVASESTGVSTRR